MSDMGFFWDMMGVGGLIFLFFAGLALVMQANKRTTRIKGTNLSEDQLQQIIELAADKEKT